jgi:hypothetical protein
MFGGATAKKKKETASAKVEKRKNENPLFKKWRKNKPL